MSASETELLIVVAEAMLNKARIDVANEKAYAAMGNNFFTGFSKSVTDAYAQSAELGDAWIKRIEGLIAAVKGAGL